MKIPVIPSREIIQIAQDNLSILHLIISFFPSKPWLEAYRAKMSFLCFSMPTNLILLIITLQSISGILLPVSALNHEGLSLLSWLSAFNSSPSSSLFSSWDPTHHNPCKWEFITCSSTGLVSAIEIKSASLFPTEFPIQILSFPSLAKLVLHDTNITGEIPSGIANLTSLIELDLRYNFLTRGIPPEIGKLSNLRFVYLSSNTLQGQIPPEIANCSELRNLELVDNQLFGRVPAEIGKLSFLQIFRAGGNLGISGDIPSEISGCKELVFLGLADTSVSGQIPSSIGELRQLTTLAIYTSNLSGTIPSQLGNCSALKNLFLYENKLTGQLPEELGQLKNLESVLLWKNSIIGRIPESIGNSTYLNVLDLSLNSLTGDIPTAFSNLVHLEVFLLSYNNMSGNISSFIGNLSSLKQLELDNNLFSGEIPAGIGQLKGLTRFFAWQNRLQGNMPFEIGGCQKLQELDLSYNFLTGLLPYSLFTIGSLNKLMLISNGFSGDLPPHIGNCTRLTRLRLGFNRFTGRIPAEIGLLRRLIFLELAENQLSREIPREIGNCTQLEMLDFHENKLEGNTTMSFESLIHLNVLDLSKNILSGLLPEVGKLKQLNKLTINGNYFTGSIPKSLGLCENLEFLDMSRNGLTGSIPREIGRLEGLDILLNLSWNHLSGPLPAGFSNLSKLTNLDLSHNMLTGDLSTLGGLGNLVSLDASFNNFSGYLPDTMFFGELPLTVFSGNRDLCTNRSECYRKFQSGRRHPSRTTVFSLAFSIVLAGLISVLVLLLMIRARMMRMCQTEGAGKWELTPFQKLSFSVEDIVNGLSDSNVIGQGSSGIVYRVSTRTGITVAVKKHALEKSERDYFAAEVKTLGSIRHKNIVRLLGYCSKREPSAKLLIFDYITNGSLDSLLHNSNTYLNWDMRYRIALGAAQGLAYLHHDCNPPIIHRDIKAGNMLIGSQFEAYLADFGLAKLVDIKENTKLSGNIVGSFGYIAPEYSCRLKITEKSDVYSYGVVLLEILTGLRPTDKRIPRGSHIVEWVASEVRTRNVEAIEVLDDRLRKQDSSEMEEMIQVFGMALLCVNPAPEERPSMRDVATVLKEIRVGHRNLVEAANVKGEGFLATAKAAAPCSSFSRSSELLLSSSF